MCRRQAHVVKHRARIEKLGIEFESTALSGQCTPVVNPARMVEEKCGLGIPDQLRDRTREAGRGGLKRTGVSPENTGP